MAHIHIHLPHPYPTPLYHAYLPTYPPTPPNDFLDPLTETREHVQNRHITHTFLPRWTIHSHLPLGQTHRAQVHRHRYNALHRPQAILIPIQGSFNWGLEHMSTLATFTAHILHLQYCNFSISPPDLSPYTHIAHTA